MAPANGSKIARRQVSCRSPAERLTATARPARSPATNYWLFTAPMASAKSSTTQLARVACKESAAAPCCHTVANRLERIGPQIGLDQQAGEKSREFPYSVVYLEQPDRVWIVAVMHAKRQPGYWHNRL